MASNQQDIRLGDRFESLDKEVRAWARLTRKKLLFRVASLNLEERIRIEDKDDEDYVPPLKESIKSSVRKKQGDLESVAFKFVRHGIFLEHGVGRGRPKGSSKAKKAAKPWLSVVLPDATQELANIIEEEYADLIDSELRLMVPGIIDINLMSPRKPSPTKNTSSNG